MMKTARYTLRDTESGLRLPLPRCTLQQARRCAEEWAADGAYDRSAGTIWVDVDILSARGEVVETVTVALDPDEPSCPSDEGEHDWQSPHALVGGLKENPGVFGHGGGVIIHEACVRCGAHRVTNTWAQRRDTGEQGLRSVRYDGPGYYDLPEEEEDLPEEEEDLR